MIINSFFWSRSTGEDTRGTIAYFHIAKFLALGTRDGAASWRRQYLRARLAYPHITLPQPSRLTHYITTTAGPRCAQQTDWGSPNAISQVFAVTSKSSVNGLVDRFRISTRSMCFPSLKLVNLHCNCYPAHSEVDFLVHERCNSFINENI